MLDTDVQAQFNKIGDLSGLTTSAKDNLVNAIKENTTQLAQKAQQADLDTTNANVNLKADKTYVDSKIGSIGSTKTFKGSSTFASLPTSGNTNGDYYYVTDKTTNYCWNGTSWVDIGNNVSIGDGTITRNKLDTNLQNFVSVSPNLVNPSNIVADTYMDTTTGATHSNTAYNYASIPVSQIDLTGKTIYFSMDGVPIQARYVTCMYPGGVTYSAANAQNVYSYTVPTTANLSSVVVTYAKSAGNYNDIQVQLNGVSTYVPYGQFYLSDQAKNTVFAGIPDGVIKWSKMSSDGQSLATMSTNLVDPALIVSGKYMDLTGATNTNSGYNYQTITLPTVGKTLYFSNNGIPVNARFITVSQSSGVNSSLGVQNVTSFTVPANTTSLTISFASSYSTFQIEYDTVTSYCPKGQIRLTGNAFAYSPNAYTAMTSPNMHNSISDTVSYYMDNSGATNYNTAYNYTSLISVNSGDVIYFSNDGAPVNARFITAYTGSAFNSSLGAQNVSSYTVPSGITGLYVSFQSGYTKFQIEKNQVTPYRAYNKILVSEDSLYFGKIHQNILRYNNYVTTNLMLFLPNDLYVAQGRTIEIYNNQVCINLPSNLHIQWSSAIGKQLKRKFVIPASLAVGNYSLTLNIVNDSLFVIYTQTITIHVVSNTLPACSGVAIGDSLTNGKAWLGELRNLSNNNLTLVGTRGTAPLQHEGRSGWQTYQYLGNYAYTYENEGVHPFWDGTRFNWNYYKTTYSINPTFVMIFLGMNGLSTYSSSATDLKTMVDYIRQDDVNIPILIALPHFKSSQNGIGNQIGSDGYSPNPNNYKFLDDTNTFNYMTSVYNLLSGYNKLYFVWLPQTHDSENNYGQQSISVNPRSSLTETFPLDSTHPQLINGVYPGYLQFADTMYSVICKAVNG
jgi:hypothetical protein